MPERRNALVVRLHSLGDIVLASRTVEGLSENFDVVFLTRKEYAPVVERMPGNPVPLTLSSAEGAVSIRKHRRRLSPDRIIDLQGNLTTLLGLWPHRRSTLSIDRSLRRAVLASKSRTMPLRSIACMRAASINCPDPSPVLQRRGYPPGDSLRTGIVVGGRWPCKTIPDGHLAELIRLLVDRREAEVVLLGTESARMERIAGSCYRDGVTVTRPSSIGALIERIETLDLLVSPDSGPAHLARALGVPVLVVFTSTSPALGFWEEGFPGIFTAGDLPCRPCHRHGGKACAQGGWLCRTGIVPLELCEAAERLIGL
jgi:heptosyltransferase-2